MLSESIRTRGCIPETARNSCESIAIKWTALETNTIPSVSLLPSISPSAELLVWMMNYHNRAKKILIEFHGQFKVEHGRILAKFQGKFYELRLQM